jgi:hypothetical protein
MKYLSIIRRATLLILIPAIFSTQFVNAQPSRDNFVFYLENNFNDDQLGHYLLNDYYSDWRTSGGSRQSAMDILSESGVHGKFMRGYFPVGTTGPYKAGWSWYSPVPGKQTEIYFSYDVRFKPGFQWVLGGKLPGLFGGIVNAGTLIKPSDGFSIRPMWRDGKIVFYVYHHNQGSIYGDSFILENFNIVTGNWFNITIRIVLNSVSNNVGANNGILEGFINGKLLFQKANFRFRNSENITIENFYICSFFGGEGSEFNSARDEWIDTDNFVAYSYSSKASNVPKGYSLSSASNLLVHPYFGSSGTQQDPPVVQSPSSGSPAAPTNLINTVKTNSLITLQWEDRSNNETGFSIFRSWYPDKDFTEIGKVGPNIKTFTSSSLPSMTRYFYKVRAFNGVGSSNFTAAIGVTTLVAKSTAATTKSAIADSSQNTEASQNAGSDPLPDNALNGDAMLFNLEVFPNPISESATLRITRESRNSLYSDITVRLVDIGGNEFYRESFSNSSGIFNMTHDFSAYPKGSYLLQVISGKNIKTEKIILQ